MVYKKIIEQIYHTVKNEENNGELASYIPELQNVDSSSFGIHIATIEQENFGVGDYQKEFSIQSIAKVLALIKAYQILKDKLWERVGVEPSGTPFNSLVQLEADKGIPRNPFINSGAIVICDILITHLEHPKEDFLAFCREVTDIKSLEYSPIIVASEKSVGFRNIASCNLIKSFGNIQNDPNEVLDLYFNLCSLEMSCEQLSKAYLFLANDGIKTSDGERVLSVSQNKRLNALMQTCGFYDESGDFAFKVGLPGKSGVGGGIVAIHPNQYCIVVWSPKLNGIGNSYRGMRFLELFTTASQSSIF